MSNSVVVTTPAATGSLTERDAPGDFSEAAFDAALEAAGLVLHKALEMEASAPPAARGLAAEPEPVHVDVEPPPGMAALMLVEDETGALRWQLPAVAPAAARGFADTGVHRFSIRLTAPAAERGTRSLGGFFKKILKVFVYPVTDLIVGAIARPIVRAWESSSRPYQLRTYTTQNYRIERSRVPALGHEDWTRINAGRSLLFVHGTFSSSDAFRDLPPSTMAALESAYKGRMFAFDHPTLGDDPTANVAKLIELIPRELRLRVDIVSHSRGGLVARELSANGAGRLSVGKLVMVGVPNRGTALASADHIASFIDRYTTITKLVPGMVGAVLDAIVFAVKVLAHGLIGQLAGLRAMDPEGAFLKRLAQREGLSSPDYYAIASDYEPRAGTPLFSIARAADAAADAAFGQAGNDLVVPSAGVSQLSAALSVPAANVFAFGNTDAVIHTDFFSQERTSERLKSWLSSDASRADGARGLAMARASKLAPDVLRSLRPHVVNLSNGTFARSGQYTTLPSEVDEIFDKHLPSWAEQRVDPSQPARIMIWAHGGLIGEQAGLEIARKHVRWWLQNDVYPIYFVWETGFFDALRSIAEVAAAKFLGLGKRDLREQTSDPVIELGCRALGGAQIWGAMKQNAARASEQGNGAYYVAQRLAEYRAKNPQVEVHAAGHSAGSIFHAYFLKAATDLYPGPIKSLHLLAPAIRVDEFDARLLPLMSDSKRIEHTTMYTMSREYELADSCFQVYGKSLLYLIHHALEPDAREPILGLEMSLRHDPKAARAFGLDGRAESGQVIWARTDAASGDAASQSTSHGGFDDDPPTLGSIAARVLGRPEPLVVYPQTRSAEPAAAADWLSGVDTSGGQKVIVPETPEVAAPPAATTSSVVTGDVANDTFTSPVMSPVSTGRRLALCVGIDAYPGGNALQGCVNDATRWAEYLRRVGFEVTSLHNTQATHSGITSGLEALLRSARAGDSVVFQYAGHGYHVPDLDGDEAGGEDQALVPIDFADGAFLIDDDLRELLLATPSGVRVTCFMDCCHSGTNSRLLMDRPTKRSPGKRRFLALDEQQRRAAVDKYTHVRSAMRRDAVSRGFAQTAMTWVSFAACQDWESALEHDGSGDFTRIALGVLSRSTDGLRHTQLFQQIQEEFGPQREQTPVLDCPPHLRDGVLFRAS